MGNVNNTSQDEGYNCSNISSYEDYKNCVMEGFIEHVASCVIISVGLLLTLAAICSLCSMVKDGNVAPLYVINLLITDILQFCCMIGMETSVELKTFDIFFLINFYFLFVSVGFMVCISLERYLVIAWPLWYRFRRTIKISVGVCVLVWILPIVLGLISPLLMMIMSPSTIDALFILLPLPLFIFFLVGTIKALSASISVPSDEKRRIVGVLVLVLLIYLLLFLPSVIWFLKTEYDFILDSVSFMFLELSPLADLFLYIFMKKGAIDKLLSSLCRCRMDSSDNISTAIEMTTV